MRLRSSERGRRHRLNLAGYSGILRRRIAKMRDSIVINPFVDFPVCHSAHVSHHTQDDQEECEIVHDLCSGVSFPSPAFLVFSIGSVRCFLYANS